MRVPAMVHMASGEPADGLGVGAVVVVDLGIGQAGAVVNQLMDVGEAQPGRLAAACCASRESAGGCHPSFTGGVVRFNSVAHDEAAHVVGEAPWSEPGR